MNQLTKLTDKLLGASTLHKSEEEINFNQSRQVLREFKSLRSFWSKALYLVYLRESTDPSLKAIGYKLERDLRYNDKEVYDKHIAGFIKELSRIVFRDASELVDKLTDQLYDFGESEYTTLCRIIYSTHHTDWSFVSNATISKESKELILKPY